MVDFINYVAVSGGFATFGIAADPAAEVSGMQSGTPFPIELVAGWSVPPTDRAPLDAEVKRALHRVLHHDEWFEVPRDQAIEVMAQYAKERNGYPWRVRQTPRRMEDLGNEHHRPVITPLGRFPTAAAAAVAFGYSRQAAWDRAARRTRGWRFEDDTSPPPPKVRRGRPPKKALAG
jgi:hypothetical protein